MKKVFNYFRFFVLILKQFIYVSFFKCFYIFFFTLLAVNLEGILRAAYSPHKFQGFFLTAEKDYSDVRNLGFKASGFGTTNEVGTFHIAANAVSKFSDKCPNLVTHTSSLPKSEVQVTWTAPLSSNGCIVFRATLIEHRDIWYMDDGPFSKSLCEDEADSVDTQPSILSECRACDEAKYELTFEGLWSRHTHPKDFPSNGWLTRFSDVIGASHTYDYRFWEYGKPASEGLRQVAEFGSTRMLEGELKAEVRLYSFIFYPYLFYFSNRVNT